MDNMIQLNPSIGLEAGYRSPSQGFGELYRGLINLKWRVMERQRQRLPLFVILAEGTTGAKK